MVSPDLTFDKSIKCLCLYQLSILGWSHYVTLVMKNDHVCPDDDDAELNG